MGRDKRTKASFAFGVVVLVAAIWAVWAQVGEFEYIRLDDNLYTWDYPPVAAGLSWTGFKAVCSEFGQGAIWMPFTSLSYMLDISLFGAGPGPHHLMSVVWHAANTLLVYYLIFVLTDRKSVFAAFAAAAFWALHSQRCESVSWIASRKDLTFMFWTLLGLIAWRRPTHARVCLSYVCMALGCLSKPTAMVFPVIAFCVEWMTIGRGVLERPFRRALRYLPLFALTIVTAAIATYSQTHTTGFESRGLYEGYGCFAWRCLNAAVSIGLYFLQGVVPYGVHIIYMPHTDALPSGTVAGLATLAALCGALAWAFARRKAPIALLAGALWFLAAIGPTLGVAGGFGFHARADRFLYLPAVGLSVVLAWGLARVDWQARWRRAACLGILTAYAVAAFLNVATYRCDYTLFGHAYACDKGHWLALQHIATEMCARFGKPDVGIEMYRCSLAMEPNDQNTGSQLMYALAQRGRTEDFAEIRGIGKCLFENLEEDKNGMAAEALGMVAMREGKWDEAIRCFTISIKTPHRTFPSDEARIQRAMCRYNKGEINVAEKAFRALLLSENARVRQKSQMALNRIFEKKHSTAITNETNKGVQK